MSLLEKASIVTTPTAYGVGVLNSIKPAYALGEELVVNGNFATDSGWIKGTGWSIANGKASKVVGSATELIQLGTFPSDFSSKTFKIAFNLEVTAGSVRLRAGLNNQSYLNSSGSYVYSLTPTGNDQLKFGADSSFVGSIDNVSVKEVTDADFDFTRNSSATRVNPDYLIQDVSILSSNLVQNGNFSELGAEEIINGGFQGNANDWLLEAGITYGNNNIVFASDSNQKAIQTQTFIVGKTYKVSINLQEYTSGTITVRMGSVPQVLSTNIGVQTWYIVATGNLARIEGTFGVGVNATLSDISVKQVDPNDNWTLQNGSIINEGVATVVANGFLSSTGGNWSLYQTDVFETNTKYKVTFKAKQTSGTGTFLLGAGYGQPFNQVITSEFVNYSLDITAIVINGNLTIGGGTVGDTFEITDISVIEVQQTDIPRLDYTNGTASILLEPQSTNLIANSNFQSGWSLLSGGTITLNQAISPDGTQNAALLTGNGSASNAPYISVPVTSGTSYAFSLFVKSILSTSLRIIGFSVEAGGSAKFDLSSGVVSIAADDDLSNAKIENYGNGWYRCSVIATADGTGNALFGFESDLDINGNNFYIYGAQFEQSSFPTSIIHTSGSTVTRAAETLNNAGNSDLINSTEGVLYAEFRALQDGYLSLTDGSSANRIFLGFASLSVYTQVRVGGNVSADMITSAYPSNTILKAAVKYKANDFALWVNGVEVNTDTSGATFPSGVLNNFSFNVGGGSSPFYGNTKAVAVFKEALSDTELACLTSTNNREIFLNYYYRMQYVGANTEALSCAEQTFNI